MNEQFTGQNVQQVYSLEQLDCNGNTNKVWENIIVDIKSSPELRVGHDKEKQHVTKKVEICRKKERS